MYLNRIFWVFLILLNLGGCVTTQVAKQATVGESAILSFQVLFDDMPDPMVIWLSDDSGFYAPNPSVSALRLNPPLTGCDSIKMFINPASHDPRPLSLQPENIQAISLKSEKDEMNQWKYVNNDNCTIVLTVGMIEDIDFSGISASTSSGTFQRHNFSFPSDTSAKPSHLGLLPLTLFADAFLVTGIVVASPALVMSPDDQPSPKAQLSVSFALPNGILKETTITKSECEELLGLSHEIYTHPAFHKYGSETCYETRIADLTRAALFKLRLSFEENETLGEPFRRLSSVDGYDGLWTHDLVCHLRVAKREVCNKYTLDGWFVRNEHEINWSLSSSESNSTGEETDSLIWRFKKEIGTYCPNADLGHADAQYKIGSLYHHGYGDMKSDPIRAYVWYGLAEMGGYVKAQDALKQLSSELTPEQLSKARSQLEMWQPGQCKQELLNSIYIENE
jgi:hypothetical protein